MRIEIPAETWDMATDDEKLLMRLGCWGRIILGEPGVVMSEPPDPETGAPRGRPVMYVWDHQGLDPDGAVVFEESLKDPLLVERMAKAVRTEGDDRTVDVGRLKAMMRGARAPQVAAQRRRRREIGERAGGPTEELRGRLRAVKRSSVRGNRTKVSERMGR